VIALVLIAVGLVLGATSAGARPDREGAYGSARGSKAAILFDDFSYASRAQLAAHGWIVRTAPGWPGVAGATWDAENVSFARGPGGPANRVLRLSSTTNGTAAGTSQTQVCQGRKYLEGTYAARIRFRDSPSSGPDGDQVVETLYTISPLEAPLDRKYSELDWEYLPNGGWSVTRPTLFVTTWETFQLDPWIADNTSSSSPGSLSGWHVLVMHVAHGAVTYYLDGVQLASHGGRYYPEVPMSINFNLWFIQGGRLPAGTSRRYEEDVDWVFHRARVSLSPKQVLAAVVQLRRARVVFRDTVPAKRPALASPCNF
jgi:hypothetical protein